MRRPLLFLHANGFPAGVYRQFLDALAAHASVQCLPVIDTPRMLAGRRRWPAMVGSVVDEIRRLGRDDDGLALVGHSMGGYLALLAASHCVGAVERIVLIDTPLVTGWRNPLFEVIRSTGLSRMGGPAPIAARRRHHWHSAADAHAHFSGKPFIQRWAPGVLDDFIAHGLVNELAGTSRPVSAATPWSAASSVSSPASPSGAIVLRIARESERDIYAHLPARRALLAYRALRRKGVPISAVAGRYSRETELAGRATNRRLFGERWHELPTGHLIPMEAPLACAQAVAACLDDDRTTTQRSPDAGHVR